MATHAVINADRDGVITGWDAGAVVLFGHSADEALGHRLDLVLPEHLREAHWVGFRRAMEHPEVKDLAAEWVRGR